MQLIDSVTGIPRPINGVNGKPIIAQPADGSSITPDNITIYDPPIYVSVWDATTQNITVVPYGIEGDASVTFAIKPGMTLPVSVKQVLVTGTTATVIRGQSAYIAGALISGNLLIESGAALVTEGGTPLTLES